jgi:hypothetical protein
MLSQLKRLFFSNSRVRAPRKTGVPTDDRISLGGVSISRPAIWIEDRGYMTIGVMRTKLTSSELCFGSTEQNPVVSFVIGLVLMAMGVPALRQFLDFVFNGGHYYFYYELAFLFLFVLGFWLAYRSLAHRGYYLLARGNFGSKKLPFHDKITLEKIRSFLVEARQRYEFSCDDKLP